MGKDKPTRSWVYKTDKEGEIRLRNSAQKISGAELYLVDGVPKVPLGTLVIRETKAPEGYEASNATWIVTFTADAKGDVVRNFYNGASGANINNMTYLGKAAISVGNAATEGSAAIAEEVSNPTISTTALDAATKLHEGFWKKEQLSIIDTVKLDKLVQGQTYRIKGVLMDKASGQSLKDAKGREITQELTFKANANTVSQSLSFSVDKEIAKDKEIVVFEKLYWINSTGEELRASHEDLADANQTVSYPEIQTSAKDKVSGGHEGCVSEKVTIVDRVSYSKLIKGHSYTMRGSLYDKETGEALLDENGKEISAEKSFTAASSDGSLELEFTVSGSVLEGKSIVVFEDAYTEGKQVASHADLTDEEQTVSYPKIRTSARDDITEGKDGYAGEKVTITDTVSYQGLKSGKEYEITGILMDKATGKAITDENGKAVRGSTKFTAEESRGEAEVHFTCEGSLVEGKDVVVFEEMKNVKDDSKVAEHKDINDEDQLVTYPKIRTTATDAGTEDHEGLAEGLVVIKDVVKYEKLKVGQSYTMTGSLMNKASGEAILDAEGKAITVSREFVPTERDGEVTIRFEVPSELVEGKHVVAYETCSRDGKEVAVHADLEDENQTVTYPKVRTTATDVKTQTHYAAMEDSITLKDLVSYEGLEPGKTYVLETVLMNRNTEEVIPVTSVRNTVAEESGAGSATETVEVLTTSFVPEEESGRVEVSFSVNKADLMGSAAVVFEKVYNVNEEGEKKDLIGKHEDLSDEEQTVYIPEIHTTALDDLTKEHEGLASGVVKINDRVSYKGLKVGEEYTVSGSLMDKASGKAMLDQKGNAITATATFIAEAIDGDVQVTFEVPAELVAGKKVVAFESVKYQGLEIAVHADIEDEDQTVSYPKIQTSAKIKGAKSAEKSSDMTVVDTVSYENLIIGKEYEVEGLLMDKSTGEAYTVDGKEISAKAKFTPTQTSGMIELSFHFDGSSISEEKQLVAFETLKQNGLTVAEHKDLNDDEQTVGVTLPEKSETVKGSVKTGDDGRILTWLSLFALSMVGIGLLFYKRRKAR